jgi:antitoxin (DNA-binding transcriptional repressor) of toxin-antitoxin stability system
MSATITMEEAQAHLRELIGNLAPGQELVITEGERPVAKIVGQSLAAGKPRRQREGQADHPQRRRRASQRLRGVHGVRLLLDTQDSSQGPVRPTARRPGER